MAADLRLLMSSNTMPGSEEVYRGAGGSNGEHGSSEGASSNRSKDNGRLF